MGFHRLSLLLYHAGDRRSEECTGSRRYTGYPEKQRRRSCVELYRLCHKSPLSIVLWQCHCLPAQGEKIQVTRKCEEIEDLPVFSLVWQISVRIKQKMRKQHCVCARMSVCLWVCSAGHSAIPHTVIWWRASASKSFQCVYVWSPMMLRCSTSAALTQMYRPGNLHNNIPIWSPISPHVNISVLPARGFCVCELLFSYTFDDVFVLFSSGRRKKRKEQWPNEWICWTPVIYSWERASERDRISKPFSYFQNGVGNQQLDWAQISDFFYLFTAHKGLILGLLEPPM